MNIAMIDTRAVALRRLRNALEIDIERDKHEGELLADRVAIDRKDVLEAILWLKRMEHWNATTPTSHQAAGRDLGRRADGLATSAVRPADMGGIVRGPHETRIDRNDHPQDADGGVVTPMAPHADRGYLPGRRDGATLAADRPDRRHFSTWAQADQEPDHVEEAMKAVDRRIAWTLGGVLALFFVVIVWATWR